MLSFQARKVFSRLYMRYKDFIDLNKCSQIIDFAILQEGSMMMKMLRINHIF